MSSPDRARGLIADALELLDQADNIESKIRAGETVTLSSGEVLRGENALSRLDGIRESVALPLCVSAAINLERIAGALEVAGEHTANGRAGLGLYTTAELSAELADRLNHEGGRPA